MLIIAAETTGVGTLTDRESNFFEILGMKYFSASMHEVFFETSEIKEEIWEEVDKFLNKIFPN